MSSRYPRLKRRAWLGGYTLGDLADMTMSAFFAGAFIAEVFNRL